MQPSALAIAAVLIAIGTLLSLSPRTAGLALLRQWIIPFVLPALLERFWIYSQIGVLRFRTTSKRENSLAWRRTGGIAALAGSRQSGEG
jgi:hypothetical protein